jgi:hypothetical protein
MSIALILVLVSVGVLATALLTFVRIDAVVCPPGLYAAEHEVDSVTTRSLLRRQHTILTNFRLIQGEKCLPIVPFGSQHSARFVDLREITSVRLTQGMSFPALALAIAVAVSVLPLGWLLFVGALVYRVVALEFRTNTLSIRVLAFRWRSAGITRFLGAVQRIARADKGLPKVLEHRPEGWDLPSSGWFDLDRVALVALAVLVATPLAQYLLAGSACVGDPVLGGLIIAMPAVVGSRRGIVAGASVGLFGVGGLLGGLCPLPFVHAVVPGPIELLAAGLMLGFIGLAAGTFAKYRPALGPFAVLAWLALPALFDFSLYQMSSLYIAVAAGGALSAAALAMLAWAEGGVRTRKAGAETQTAIPIANEPLPMDENTNKADRAIGAEDPVFYVMDGDKTVGPVTGLLLRRGLEAGKVPIGALVWKKGWPSWRNLGEVAPLLDTFRSVRPEPLPTGQGLEALGRPSLPPPGAPERRAK